MLNLKNPFMKTRFLACIILFLFLMDSCQREDSEPVKPKGLLEVNIGLFMNVNEVNSSLKSTLGAEDFKVIIYNAAGEEVVAYDRASEMPAEIELEIGNYYVAAHSDNNFPAAFENPYYYGESDPFIISAGSSHSATVNCELANSMVSVIYSENIKSNFAGYTTTVSTSAGSLTFAAEETRAGFFQPLPLSIIATLTREKSDGSVENTTLTGTVPSPQPKKHYEIHIDATGGTGIVLCEITLDESTDPVEIVEITGNNDPVAGEIGQGGLLITEIMYDPASLADTEGEWIEIFNNTNATIDLQNLVIRKNDTESHIINSQFILASHGYGVLARTENTVPGDKYIYRTDITLNNTGAVLSICNYGTDGTDGSVICSVDYGSDGFPGASGASICLDPDKLNATEVITGSSWCVSSSSYGLGDLGTPGSTNDQCN
jgi:hypothetical protein